ncbi:MAG: hypothetical protein OIF34_07645, partial [Porticoccaceae bacterium]|nr:hypothetical protein [Porticoccaceae bacterium]
VPPCSSTSCSAVLGPEGETRATFDDVDDYDGLNEAPSENALGIVRPEYQNYRIAVQVSYAHDDFSRIARTVKRVEVAVTPPGQSVQRFVAYRGNF